MLLRTLNPLRQERHNGHLLLTPEDVLRRLEGSERLECRVVSASSRTPAAPTRFIARMTRGVGSGFPWMAEGTLLPERGGTTITIVVSRSATGVLAGCAYWLLSIGGAMVAFAAGKASVAIAALVAGMALALLEVRQSAPGGPALAEAIMHVASASDATQPSTD